MKKAIITGASSGLGLEIGKLLQKEGIDIVNLSRNKSPFENVNVNGMESINTPTRKL